MGFAASTNWPVRLSVQPSILAGAGVSWRSRHRTKMGRSPTMVARATNDRAGGDRFGSVHPMTLAATEQLEVTPTERRGPVFGELALISALVSRALAGRSAEPHAPQQETVPWSDLVLPGSVFARLAASCGLDEAEAGLVVLAVAPAVSHRLATAYALIRHDPDAQLLSPSVAMAVLGIDGVRGVEALLGALQPGRALVDLELVHVQPGGVTSVRDNIVPSSRLLAFVLGDVALPADVGLAARLEASRRCPEPLLGEAPARHFAEALAQLRQAVAAGDRSAIPVCVLIGREGTGRGLCALHLAAALGQPAATMHADIIERLDPVGRGADDDDRLVEDVVGDEVADLLDLLEPAGHLPDLGPERIGLAAGIVGGDIGFDREQLGFASLLRRWRLHHIHDAFPLRHPPDSFPTVGVASKLLEGDRAGT